MSFLPTVQKLDNQLQVLAIPMKERSSVSTGIWVHTGARHEEDKISGVSHFLEHIVFKGTHSRTANQIKESIEGVGGSMNAFTSEEYTCFLAKVAKKHFNNVFDVLSDMVLNASLREADIEKERTVIMEEIKMTQDQPSQLVDELLSEIVWLGHPLGRPIAGTLETVGVMSKADIQTYRDKHYIPRLITIVAAGDIDSDSLMTASLKRFSIKNSHERAVLNLFKPRQDKPRIKVFTKSTEQTHISLALRSHSRNHEDEYSLDLLNVILGGNMSSRLFNEVREERGLAYDVGSGVRRYHETGAFVVSAGVDNKKTKEALEVILKELEKITQNPVSMDELRRARDFYLGQLDLGLENSMNQMLWGGENLVTLGRYKRPEEVFQKIESVTPDDITRVAKNIFITSALNLAVVGPSKSEKEFKDLLHFSHS